MTVTNLPTIDRIPPQNLEAEMALLGSILVDREIMGESNDTCAARFNCLARLGKCYHIATM